MIYLKPELFDDLEAAEKSEDAKVKKAAVLKALQQAVELEHATIPLYLYALYSLDPNKNATIRSIIRSVVIEEMLHMTLVCNILNALCGSPEIDKKGFIPTYPGPLPGGVESDLKVHFAPFSFAQLCMFMKIEEPEFPPVAKSTEAAHPRLTIGQFYRKIEHQLRDLDFNGDPSRQIDRYIAGTLVVKNYDTAKQAIDTIVQQGEGTPNSPDEGPKNTQYAHYYRFAEIAHGKMLIPNPNPKPPPGQEYIYNGPDIPFDRSGVFAVPTDPKAVQYEVGSPQRLACEQFNCAYTQLLKTLHDGFNGKPKQISVAKGLMNALGKQAADMMSGIHPSGFHVGPSFEYTP